MKNLIIIAAVVVLATTASAGVPTPWIGAPQIEIPVLMDIVEVASLNLNKAQILLERVGGTTDYMGVTKAPFVPTLTCNAPVTVYAETAGVAPWVTELWQTSIRNTDWSTPGNPCGGVSIDVDPLVTPMPYPIEVAVMAQNVDMSVRPLRAVGPVAIPDRVATTTVTVTPRP